ncbi:hypothetical protein T492DRAFT_547583 [Pavlovales sp. CCMP2436]|nr:hypothetical protein T492DRAFT_547583 [Pavlovales sp. CCMP2436]
MLVKDAAHPLMPRTSLRLDARNEQARARALGFAAPRPRLDRAGLTPVVYTIDPRRGQRLSATDGEGWDELEGEPDAVGKPRRVLFPSSRSTLPRASASTLRSASISKAQSPRRRSLNLSPAERRLQDRRDRQVVLREAFASGVEQRGRPQLTWGSSGVAPGVRFDADPADWAGVSAPQLRGLWASTESADENLSPRRFVDSHALAGRRSSMLIPAGLPEPSPKASDPRPSRGYGSDRRSGEEGVRQAAAPAAVVAKSEQALPASRTAAPAAEPRVVEGAKEGAKEGRKASTDGYVGIDLAMLRLGLTPPRQPANVRKKLTWLQAVAFDQLHRRGLEDHEQLVVSTIGAAVPWATPVRSPPALRHGITLRTTGAQQAAAGDASRAARILLEPPRIINTEGEY